MKETLTFFLFFLEITFPKMSNLSFFCGEVFISFSFSFLIVYLLRSFLLFFSFSISLKMEYFFFGELKFFTFIETGSVDLASLLFLLSDF